MSLPIPPGSKFDPNTGAPIPKFDPQTGKQNWSDDSPAAVGIAVPACVPVAPGGPYCNNTSSNTNNIVVQNVQQGGGRAHKYDASVLSGAWMMDNEACPGCCPWQVNIMAMGQDAFQFGPSKVMFTRDGGTDNFRSQRGAQGESGPCMALVLSENDIKLRGNENFTLTKINRTNLVDRAQPQPPMPQVMQHY